MFLLFLKILGYALLFVLALFGAGVIVTAFLPRVSPSDDQPRGNT